MSISEIFNIEENRKDSSEWNVIHLIREGSFYRAHDWSAWLMSAFPFGEATKKRLSVTAKMLNDGRINAFVGFPTTSLEKYIPNDGSVAFLPIDNNRMDVRIELPADLGEVSFESLDKMRTDWIASLPLTENKKNKREMRDAQNLETRAPHLLDIVSQVMSFPLESKSPKDAWEFVRNMRTQINAIM